jgi:DNA replication protein DnaC
MNNKISNYMLVNKIIEEKIQLVKKEKMENKSVISEKQLRKLFSIEATEYYNKSNKNFAVDDKNKKYLNLLCKYFSKSTAFEKENGGDLNKGLFVTGETGSGKTSSFKIIQNISLKYKCKQLWFPMRETDNVVLQFNLEKHKDDIVVKYSKGLMLFDDLGAENHASNVYVYGKEDIFIRILEARYRGFINKGTKTHITTNLTLNDIKTRYGTRVEDRFIEMFNVLKLNGKRR